MIDFIKDFLTILNPMMDIVGETTDLLDNEEFMKEFKLYLND